MFNFFESFSCQEFLIFVLQNINFAQNPVALIIVVVVFVIFLLAAIRSYQLDKRDIESVSVVPLCGPNQSFKYEITVKTSPGIGSGKSVNVVLSFLSGNRLHRQSGVSFSSRSNRPHSPTARHRCTFFFILC